MAERIEADVLVAPLDRALLDGIPNPTGGPSHRVDLAVLPIFEDERPLQGFAGLIDWRMGGYLSSLVRSGFCTGASAESVLLPGRRTLPIDRFVLMGLGPSAAFDATRADALAERWVGLVNGLSPTSVLVAMPGRVTDRSVIEAIFGALIRTLVVRRGGYPSGSINPVVRAVRDDGPWPSSVATVEPERSEPGVGEESASSMGPTSARVRDRLAMSPRVRQWWVIADPRYEARLRRLLDGPPRAAERGA